MVFFDCNSRLLDFGLFRGLLPLLYDGLSMKGLLLAVFAKGVFSSSAFSA
jgi:hypothetical protein